MNSKILSLLIICLFLLSENSFSFDLDIRNFPPLRIKRNIEKGSEPSWFPKKSCRSEWINRQSNETRKKRNYLFDFKKFPKSKYKLRNNKGIAVRQRANGKLVSRYQDYLSSLKSVSRQNCYKETTFLVAMDGDNDLHPYSIWDLFEMEAAFNDGKGQKFAGSTIKMDLVVQQDGDDSKGASGRWRLHMFESDRTFAKDYSKKFFKDKSIRDVKSPVIDVLPEFLESDKENNSAKMKSFRDFVSWGMKEYPAKNYVVILWGHGKGWMWQDEQDESVHLRGGDLASALKDIYEKTLESKRPIDNFVADACFMQSLELGMELSPYVRFMSGSAQIQTFLGLPYRRLIYEYHQNFQYWDSQTLVKPKDKSDKPALIAKILPQLMKASLDAGRGIQGQSEVRSRFDGSQETAMNSIEYFTYSSLDMTIVRNFLARALQTFATELIQYLKIYPKDREKIVNLAIRNNNRFRSGLDTRDLGHFINAVHVIAKSRLEQLPQGKKLEKEQLLSMKRAFHVTKRALESAVHSKRFAKKYLKDKNEDQLSLGQYFSALGAWLPKRKRKFQKDLGAFENTILYNYPQLQSHSVFEILDFKKIEEVEGLDQTAFQQIPAWSNMLEDLFE